MQEQHRSDLQHAGLFVLAAGAPIALMLLTTIYSWTPAGLPGWARAIAAFIAGDLVGGAFALLLYKLVGGVSSSVLGRATGLSGGGATQSAFAMSQVQSLVIRGRVDEAVAQLQSAMYAHQGQTGAEIAQTLGDLLSFRLQQFDEAARVYRRARRTWQGVGGTAGREGAMHCTRRLIDLYDGPIGNPAAAEQERQRAVSAAPVR